VADTGLYPTPNRLALLADVKAGHVHRVIHTRSTGPGHHDRNSLTGRRCTADMADMARAMWVDLHLVVTDTGQQWVITAVGEAVLARPMHPDSAACHPCYDANPGMYLQTPTLCQHRIDAATAGEPWRAAS
jgi:hypothetical protein